MSYFQFLEWFFMNSFLPSVAPTPLDHQRDFNTKGGEGEGSLLATYLHACPLPAGILGTSRKWEALALICWFLKRNTLLSRHPQDALDFTHFIRDLDSPPLWNGPTPGAPTVLPTPPHTPLSSFPQLLTQLFSSASQYIPYGG